MGKWKDCCLGEIITLQRGFDLPRTKAKGGKYPVVGSNGIIGYHDCYTTEAPSITIGRSGNVGKPFIYFGKTWAHNTTLFIKEFKQVDPVFTYYLLKTLNLSNYAGGSAVPTLNRNHLYSLPVYIPSQINDQQRIANFLHLLDDKIELNNQINGNLQQLAFELFGKLMSASQESKCQLNSIAILNPKRTLPRNKSARCIEMSKLSTSCSFPAGWVYKAYNGGATFKNGDTLMARITPCLENGKAGFINFLDEIEIAFGSTEYIVISTKGDIPPEFFYCLVRSPKFIDYAKKNMNGSSGRQRVSAEVIGKYELPALTTEMLSEFNTIVPSLFKKIRDNSVENMKLAQMRDCLLPKLMSGELDVSDIDL